MSKYYGKKQPQQARQPGSKGKFPLALLAVLGALLLIIAGVLVLTRPAATGGETAPSSATGSGPRVAVDQEKLDFGKVKMDTPVTAAFKVRNAGTEPLQIIGQPQVRVVEGC